MQARPVVSALLDLAAGLVAITLVVGSCFISKSVAFDLRALFTITGVMFFTAALLRGSARRRGYAWRLVRVTVPGLLGTAALIVSNGLHRLEVPIGLILMALFAVASGFAVCASWTTSRNRALLAGAVALIAIAAGSCFLVPGLSSRLAFVKSNQQVGPFSLAAGDRSISSTSLQGRVVVMAFWTSWCATCIQEMPQIQKVSDRYRGNPRVAVYAVEIGWDGETPEAGRRCFARYGFKVPVAFDSGDLAHRLNIDAIPAIALMDATGRLRLTHAGFDVSEDLASGLERQIDKLLAAR